MRKIILPVLVFALLLLVRERDATAQLSRGAGGPGKTTPTIELPSDDCFGRYLVDQVFCEAIYCEELWFLVWEWTSCDEDEMEKCLADAQAGLEECLAGQGS